MQTARDLVGAAAELASGMQGGHHHLEGALFLFRMDIHRDTTPVILHGHGAIRMDGYDDLVANPSQGFINGVIHHLVDQVVQRLQIRAAHVHPRAPADCLQAFQHLDILGGITCIFRSHQSHNFLPPGKAGDIHNLTRL